GRAGSHRGDRRLLRHRRGRRRHHRLAGEPVPRTRDMSFPYEKAIELLEAAHANGRLAHAYLITGPSGSGKERLAIRMIEMVNERDRTKGATSLEELRSSSTSVIGPESKSRRIGVEAIRNVEHVLQMAAPTGVTKFAVVKDADR